jgi:hypothetical protein
MGISGTWSAKQNVPYLGAMKQGTGWNPVHAVRDGEGRNIAPDAVFVPVPDQFVNTDDHNDQYGYMAEDHSSALWGYGTETGTADRPRLDDVYDRASTGRGYPPAGRYRSGVPGGTAIRALDHGAEATMTAKQTQPDAQQGWVDKYVGVIDDAEISDPAQYEMQTSMTQMSKDRTGSQRGSGSDSPYDARVPGRRWTMGQRKYLASTGERLSEMAPKQQNVIIRRFGYRQAGTGNPELMQPNAATLNRPFARTPAADPYVGDSVPGYDVAGFVDEGWSSE